MAPPLRMEPPFNETRPSRTRPNRALPCPAKLYQATPRYSELHCCTTIVANGAPPSRTGSHDPVTDTQCTAIIAAILSDKGTPDIARDITLAMEYLREAKERREQQLLDSISE